MQPSSLIFLILIAIWAAYLLQHWVRRREHLATARSVDRFSDAMRVLERRSPLPDVDLSAPRPRSYALGPTRPSRQEAVVKRAHSLRTPARRRPDIAEIDATVRPTRVFRVLAGVSARRLRGLSLVASLMLALVVVPLAALSLFPWWSILVVVLTLAADVAWLRHVAVSERVAGRGPMRERGAGTGRARSEARHSDYFESASGAEPLFEVEDEVDGQSEPDDEDDDDDDHEEVYGAASSAELTGRIDPRVDVDPSGWAPVPVPPPTYTLKAKAADPVPEPIVVTGTTGAENWSLEGLVYDCDLDELVERRSATGA